MSSWDRDARTFTGNWRQIISHAPVYNAKPEDLQTFYYQLEEYSAGINTTLGDMVSDAFKDSKAARTKYGYDRDRMRKAEEADEPREPIDPHTPDLSDDDSTSSSTSSSQPRVLASRKARAEEKIEKPKGWSSMSDDAKRQWEETARRRLRRSATRKERDIYSAVKKLHRIEQAYLQRCRMFQLLIATAFSNPKVVEFLRSKNIHDPFEKVGAVKEKYGQISGAAMYVLVKRFKENRPTPTTDMDTYLTKHQLKKRWIETVRNSAFSEDEAVNDLLEKLSIHPAFGSSYINEHFKVGRGKRQTHDEIVESAREVYVLWRAKNRRSVTYTRKKEQNTNLLMEEEQSEERKDKRKKGKNRERGPGEGEDGQEWWLTATCYNCMQVGHIKRNCPKLAPTPNNSSNTNSKHKNHQRKSHKTKGSKTSKRGGKGVALLRGEVGSEGEEGEQSEEEDSEGEEDEEFGLIFKENSEDTDEEEGGGEDEHEEKEESENEEPSGLPNLEKPARVRDGGGSLQSGSRTRPTLQQTTPDNPSHCILTHAQHLRPSTTTPPASHTPSTNITSPFPPQSSRPKPIRKQKAKQKPSSLQHKLTQTDSPSTPTDLQTTPIHQTSQTIQCIGTNYSGGECKVKRGKGGSWGRAGNAAKRLSYASYCGFHAKQDPRFPEVDLQVDPTLRPVSIIDYPSEVAMLELRKDRERESAREAVPAHKKTVIPAVITEAKAKPEKQAKEKYVSDADALPDAKGRAGRVTSQMLT